MSTRDKSCVGEGVMADGERLGVKYFRLYRWINEDSKGEVEMIVFTSNTRGLKDFCNFLSKWLDESTHSVVIFSRNSNIFGA
ncbi:Uncharacterised protein [Legionella pneumophila]|nr:Uncharacterised protein [Legionella pneumophila]STX65060.1 Uncharacterised protein [Legionella pneumophila]STX68095.1 Uncharacterised protein [Legionella pneumophila]STY21417.1 Uncharacterised protein [Legionella pneumophila]